ncbi:hypothetical protein ACFL5M_01870 [Candidatus Neomarinimicrobiota bacterium]
MKYKSVPLIVAVVTSIAFAQSGPAHPPDNINRFHKVSFRMGVQQEGLMDEVYSTLLYEGKGVGLNISYELEKLYSYHRISLSGSAHSISPADESIPESFIYLLRDGEQRITHYSANAVDLNLRYDYQRLITRFTRYRLKWYLGGALDNRLYYFKRHSEQDRSWIVAYSLDASTKLEYVRSCNHAFSIQLFLPVFSLVHRPPYAGYDENTMDYSGFDYLSRVKPMDVSRYFNVSGLVSYEYYFDCKTALTFSWMSSFSRCTDPRSASIMSHQIKCGLTFLFRT